MTEPLLFLAGLLLIALVLYDFLHTTVGLNGLGPLSRRVAHGMWWVAQRVVPFAERHVGRSPRPAVGPSILIVLTLFWLALHLCGYTLMLRGGLSLVEGQAEQPANWVQTLAFAGSALSTLGSADVGVRNGFWNILSMLIALNGMLVLTLSVSFLLNILQTTLAARAFALRYNALRTHATTQEASPLPDSIASLGGDLCQVAVKLSASPLPAFFSPRDTTLDFAAAVEDLCGALAQGPDSALDDYSQLVEGVRLLGRKVPSKDAPTELAAAREWAARHTLNHLTELRS